MNKARNVTIKDLKESGMYSENLILSLMNGELKVLGELPNSLRANKDYMYPILFAIKNEMKTFRAYKYCGENIQDDFELASEIIIDEPELIKDTPISRNKKFIIVNARINPKIIEYMNPALKTDKELILEISNIDNTEVYKELIANCEISDLLSKNPQLSDNREFMSLAIIENPTLILRANPEIRNDGTFLEEVVTRDSNLIGIVTNNLESFGSEGLNGVCRAVRGHLNKSLITDKKRALGELQEDEDLEISEEDKEITDSQLIELVSEAAEKETLTEETATLALRHAICMGQLRREAMSRPESKDAEKREEPIYSSRVAKKIASKASRRVSQKESELFDAMFDEFFWDEHIAERGKEPARKPITLTDIAATTQAVRSSEMRAVRNEIAVGNGFETKTPETKASEIE